MRAATSNIYVGLAHAPHCVWGSRNRIFPSGGLLITVGLQQRQNETENTIRITIFQSFSPKNMIRITILWPFHRKTYLFTDGCHITVKSDNAIICFYVIHINSIIVSCAKSIHIIRRYLPMYCRKIHNQTAVRRWQSVKFRVFLRKQRSYTQRQDCEWLVFSIHDWWLENPFCYV